MNKQILKLAIPNILSNITVPLLGIVDTILMGHDPVHAATYIGAIGLGGVLFNAVYWNFGFLRMGTTGLTAQAYGAEDKQEQALTLFRALGIGLVLALVILALSPLLSRFGFGILRNAENAEAINFAKEYFDMRILAIPAVFCLFGLRGWFFGVQNAVVPLVLLTFVNLVNVGCSIYFVRYLGMGVRGVALGTVVAQYGTLLLAIVFVLARYRWVFGFFTRKLLFIRDKLSRFFFVNGFIFIRTSLLFVVFAAFSYYSSSVGKNYFAANQILLEMFFLLSYAVDGFAYAAESLVGKYFGAKNWDRMQEVVLKVMWWGLGFGCLYALLYALAGNNILRLFTSDDSLLQIGGNYVYWLCVIAIVGSISFIWDGIYGGATLVVEMAISMAIATSLFFVLYFSLRTHFPRHAIWLAFTIFMAARGLGQWVLFKRFAGKYFGTT